MYKCIVVNKHCIFKDQTLKFLYFSGSQQLYLLHRNEEPSKERS